MRANRNRDYFSKGVVVYAALFFVFYKALFQLSYDHELSSLSSWSWALIFLHAIALLWCMGACVFLLMPRQFTSFVCAALLVLGLQFFYPNPLLVHYWLHKSEYVARVSAAGRPHDGRLSLVVYSHANYYPGLGG